MDAMTLRLPIAAVEAACSIGRFGLGAALPQSSVDPALLEKAAVKNGPSRTLTGAIDAALQNSNADLCLRLKNRNSRFAELVVLLPGSDG